MTRIRHRNCSMRGAALVFCASLTCALVPSTAWTSKSTLNNHFTSKSRLFLSTEGTGSSSNPNPQQASANVKQDKKLKLKQRNPSTSIELQRKEMLNHDILTRKQEMELGNKIVRANEVKSKMASLVEEKEARMEQEMLNGLYVDENGLEESLDRLEQQSVDFEDLTHFSITSSNTMEEHDTVTELFDPDGTPLLSGEEALIANHYQNQQERGRLGADDWDDRLLTDEEIVVGLDLPGGRAELQRILLEGAFAKDSLIRNNVRLVVSIAKKWAKLSAKSGGHGATLTSLYAGNAHRPSLDEAIQEGILGLNRAAEKYDASRGLKFSTYATFWVENFVRNCYQNTRVVRIPAQLIQIKSQYSTLVYRYLQAKEDIPSLDAIAQELGVNVKRLKTALRATQPEVSIDSPISSSDSRMGSAAGGDLMGLTELLIADTLQCTEPQPEYQVEMSFLRQCLENAMSSLLSPHERDVLRLRLGLDDGVTRSARQVAEICGDSIKMSDVRKVEQRAYNKLRTPYALTQYELITFLDFAGLDQSTMKRF